MQGSLLGIRESLLNTFSEKISQKMNRYFTH